MSFLNILSQTLDCTIAGLMLISSPAEAKSLEQYVNKKPSHHLVEQNEQDTKPPNLEMFLQDEVKYIQIEYKFPLSPKKPITRRGFYENLTIEGYFHNPRTGNKAYVKEEHKGPLLLIYELKEDNDGNKVHVLHHVKEAIYLNNGELKIKRSYSVFLPEKGDIAYVRNWHGLFDKEEFKNLVRYSIGKEKIKSIKKSNNKI